MRQTYDVVIAGGGVMGAAVAFWLTRLGRPSVLVVEPDPAQRRSATALSVASIRQQFTTPVNVAISRFGIAFIRDFASWTGPASGVPDLGLVENGYLFLAGSQGAADVMRAAVAMQRSLGAATLLLAREAVAAQLPWFQTADVVLASFGPRDEGWFDNIGLQAGLLRAAVAAGAEVVRDRVAGFEAAGDQVTAAALERTGRIGCGTLVNATGPAAAALLRHLGEELPVEPRKRTVFVIDAPNARDSRTPLVVDHAGIYFRPEGRHWIAAAVPAVDGPAEPEDFEPDWAEFEDVVWPRLAARAPAFETARVLRAWAGHYDFNRVDGNGLVGPWPTMPNLLLACGFSGHGLQQAPAVGRGVAELILFGAYQSLDLGDLDPRRLAEGRPLHEAAIV